MVTKLMSSLALSRKQLPVQGSVKEITTRGKGEATLRVMRQGALVDS